MPVPGVVFVSTTVAVLLLGVLLFWTAALLASAWVWRAREAKVRRACLGALALTTLGAIQLAGVIVGSWGGERNGPAVAVAGLIFQLAVITIVSRFVSRASALRSLGIGLTASVATFGLLLATRPLFRAFVSDNYVVPTQTMKPTIDIGDRIMADRLLAPRRWDVVVFYAPTEPSVTYVKRLIGMPGETIEIVDGEIQVNGVVLSKPAELSWLKYDGEMSPHGHAGHGSTGSPITLAHDEYYVLGDNTTMSLDSRFWESGAMGHQPGAVPRQMMVGTVRAIYAPFRRARIFR